MKNTRQKGNKNMNKVILIGRMTKDAEVRYSQTTAVARFTLAVDRRFKKDEEQTADFINCIAFGKTAEFTEKYGKKGTKFALEGRIQTGSYKNKDGQTVYTTDIVVENIEFAESKSSNDKRPEPAAKPTDDFMVIPDDIQEELPFN